jgi:Rhs element Vgr protein
MPDVDKTGRFSYKVSIGAKDFEPGGTSSCYSISSSYKANKIPYATVVFIDGDAASADFTLSSSTDIEPGTEVTISMGYNGVNEKVFKGVIIKHSIKLVGTKSYTYIECKDPLVKMTVAKKNRVFGDGSAPLTDNANFTTIFTEYALNSRLTLAGVPYIAQNSITQFYSTDWDFILNRVEVNGKMILVQKPGDAYGKIKIDNPVSTGTAKATFTFGKDLYDFEMESNALSQIKEAEASTWKDDTQEVLKSAKATASTFSQLENTGITAASLNIITSPTTLSLFHGGGLVKAEIDGWSKAVLEKAAHSKVKGSFKIKGDYSLNLGDVVKLAGVGTKFSGNIVITGVKQEFSSSGWFTYINFGLDANWHAENFNINAPPAAGLLPGVSGLQVGKVLAYVTDPAGQHRVKIKLPMFKTTEVFWARMLFDYAGTSRGNFFWPEVDDEVLVGFLNDDPRNPVILGSMFSKATAPVVLPPTAEVDTKAIVTKSNLRIEFNDVDKVITIKTPGDNSIKIDDKAKEICIKDQHGNTVKMAKDALTLDSVGELKLTAAKKITISSSTGDVMIEGNNIKSTAKLKFEVSGNGGLDLKTSAIAEIKGSLVKIN